jgi:hypothetical protein
MDCTGGASFDASWDVVRRINLAFSGGSGFLLRRMQTPMAQIALLDDATHPHRNPGV